MPAAPIETFPRIEERYTTHLGDTADILNHTVKGRYRTLKLVIVSGLSGSGKTIALNTLEDLDYYCVDNLPVSLLESFAAEMSANKDRMEKAAVGIDVRNLSQKFDRFDKALVNLKTSGIEYEILYLDCETNTLLKRYSETRRKHPLSALDVSLPEAISRERKLLETITAQAGLIIDTSNTNVHQLRDLVRSRIENKQLGAMSLLIQSFGYKQGVPTDADFVFDARCLPNPHWDEKLRHLTGCDEPVIAFLKNQARVSEMHQHIQTFLTTWIPAFEQDNRSYLTVAIGCTGGQHRSVYLAEQLYAYFGEHFPNVSVRHRELL